MDFVGEKLDLAGESNTVFGENRGPRGLTCLAKIDGLTRYQPYSYFYHLPGKSKAAQHHSIYSQLIRLAFSERDPFFSWTEILYLAALTNSMMMMVMVVVVLWSKNKFELFFHTFGLLNFQLILDWYQNYQLGTDSLWQYLQIVLLKLL